MRQAFVALIVIVVVGSNSGCGDVSGILRHLVGTPEPAPKLMDWVAPLVGDSEWAPAQEAAAASTACAPPVEDCSGLSLFVDLIEPTLRPAESATTADMAGIWVEATGLAAMHIDQSGWVYQMDLAEHHEQFELPAIVPSSLFDVGRVMVQWGGSVDGVFVISLPGFRGSAAMTGTLDSTQDIIYAYIDYTIDLEGETYRYDEYGAWYRWDPVTEAAAYSP